MKFTHQWRIVYPSVFLTLTVFTMVVFASQGNAGKGKQIFFDHCAECHGNKGDGQGAVGPYLEGQRPANLLDEKTRARSDQELFEIIRYGVHIEMPSWEGVLTDHETLNVITYLRGLAPPFHPASD